LTLGTDASCEEYWKILDRYLRSYNTVHILNKGWIPGPKVVTSVNAIKN
jgi:hypothetical protein